MRKPTAETCVDNTAKLRPQESVYATHNERRRGKQPVHHDKVHAWRLGIDMGTTIIHLRCTTSCAAGNGLGATMKYLRHTTSAAANNGLSTTTIPPCSTAASLEEELRAPHRGTSLGPFVCGARACSLCSHTSSVKSIGISCCCYFVCC